MTRRSPRPEKQFLWYHFAKDMRGSDRFETGLDVACGPMANRPFFKTRRYIGLDADQDYLKRAAQRYPEAEQLFCRIEDMHADLRCDLAVCVQTIGINIHFAEESTLSCLKKIIGTVNPGGTFIFNIGDTVLDQTSEVDALIQNHFDNVKKVRYGTFEEKRPLLVSRLLALLMLAVPALARKRHIRTYYCCRGKH